MTYLITGRAVFICPHFVKHMLSAYWSEEVKFLRDQQARFIGHCMKSL